MTQAAEPGKEQAAAPNVRLDEALRRLHALRGLASILGATTNFDQLLEQLLEKIRTMLEAERATLFLLSDDGSQLSSRLFQGGSVAEIHLRVGEGIAGIVVQTGETINIADAYSDPRFNQEVDRLSGFRTTSILCMPLPSHEGRALGVVQVLNKRGRAFDGDDQAMLLAVAAHVGIAIENAQLHRSLLENNRALMSVEEELRRKVTELDLLVEMEREALVARDLDDLLERLLRRAMQLAEAEAGCLVLRDDNSDGLLFRAVVGKGAGRLRRANLAKGQGILGWVTREQTPLIINDPVNDPRFDAKTATQIGLAPRNLVAVPLLDVNNDGEVTCLGAIEIINHQRAPVRSAQLPSLPRFFAANVSAHAPATPPSTAELTSAGFDDADVKLLGLIAAQAARSIVLAQAKEERSKQERLASIGQLLSGILHDLKSPMTIISGYGQLLIETDDAKTRAQLGQSILKQLELMSSMMREVLQFARGENQLLIRKVSIHDFLAEMREQLEADLASRGVKLVIEERYDGLAYFDEIKLQRVVHNLARNAAQAMLQGGTLRITTERRDGELLLDFADTGGGIPEELEGRLFQLFATSGKPGGTGLGLAIVKKIVEEHGGYVSYTSRAGQGTTFHIALPLERSPQ